MTPALGKRLEKIELIPLTHYSLQARLRSAAKRAGLTADRIIHGARHHAGTAMLAKTGNLKLTQQLLGHADIKSTMRYAHALEADLRSALDGPTPNRLTIQQGEKDPAPAANVPAGNRRGS